MTAAIIAIGSALIPILATAIIAIIKATQAQGTANTAQDTADSAHGKINTVVTMNALKRPDGSSGPIN
jgi:hypothetical protein